VQDLELTFRQARAGDCAEIVELIAGSVRGLGKADYTDAQIDAALRGPWGLDTQLVRDGTYFVVHAQSELVGCGGWSFRRTLFGSDAEGSRDDEPLDPAIDAARIRAFFVRPGFARRGIGTRLLGLCESAAFEAGFRTLSLGATLPGRRLCATRGFVAETPIEYDLGGGLSMQVIPMTRRLDAL
jgi:GNAT superfamily N-acetyltransferase